MNRILKLNSNFGNHHGDVFFLGEPVVGKIEVIPYEDLQIEYLGYHFILEAKGKFSTTKKILLTKYLLKTAKLSKGKEYIFDLKFTYDGVESFKGINTNFITRLEFFLGTKDQISNRDSSYVLTKMIYHLNFTRDFNDDVYLTFKSKSDSYKIESTSGNLESMNNLGIIIVTVFACTFLFIFGFNNKIPSLYYLAIGLILLSTIWGYLIPLTLIKQLSIHYKNEESNKVTFCITNSNNWKYITEIYSSYVVREAITYRPDPNADTIVRNLFESNESSELNPTKELCFSFSYPENIPGTTTIDDSKIYWVAVVKIKLIWKLLYTYENEFMVKK